MGICGWAGLVGIIFAMQPLPRALAGVGFTNVVSFAGTNGALGSLMRGADGAFYGMTYGGGTYGQGTVFRLTQMCSACGFCMGLLALTGR